MWLTKAHTSQEAPTSISGSSSRRYNLLSYKIEDYNSLDNDLKEIINSVIKNYKEFKGISLGGLTMAYIPFYEKDNFEIEKNRYFRNY